MAFYAVDPFTGTLFKVYFFPKHINGREKLLEVIKEWIEPSTVIVSDYWKAYDCLADEDSDSTYYLWCDEASMRLIEAYKAHPKLWCRAHPGYLPRKEHRGRNHEIAEIVEYVNKIQEKPFSQKQVRMQMNNFRRCYRNCLETIEKSNGLGNPCWRFYEHMKFLGNSAHDSWPLKTKSVKKEKDQKKLLQPIKPSDVENIGTPKLDKLERKPTILQKRMFLKRLLATKLKRRAPIPPKVICTTAKWGNDGQLNLIKEYEKSPCLWDPTHPDYINPYGARINKIRRGRELAKITAALSRLNQRTFTTPEVKARILSLRLAYRKHYEEVIRTGEEPKWRLYKHMKFLGASVISLADRRENKKEMLKQSTSSSDYYQRLDRQESPELEEFIVEKSHESSHDICQAADTVSPIFTDPIEPDSPYLNHQEPEEDAIPESPKPTPECSPSARQLTPPASPVLENLHLSPLLPVESIKRSLSFQEDSEDADELASTQSKRRRLVNIEEHDETVASIAEISQSPENVDSFTSSRLSSPRSVTQLFPGLWSTSKDTKFSVSTISLDSTIQGPSLSSEAVTGQCDNARPVETLLAGNKKAPEMDKCDKLGVIVASTLKRIATSNPNRLNESIKIIKEALFNAEYEDFSSI